MKNVLQRQITLLAVLLSFLVPNQTNAYDVQLNGLYYNLNSTNKTAEVTYKEFDVETESYSGIVNIPSSFIYNGINYAVKTIGNQCFSRCKLSSVIIPNSVTSINLQAFYKCTNLTSISIPNSVTIIGTLAFQGCGLNSITIPSSVTSIGQNPFYECKHLETIKVDEGNYWFDSRNNCNAIIKSYSNQLISGCKTTDIPEGIVSIGEHAFQGCSDLASINIPKSVTSIGNYAFEGCSGLISLNLPNSVTSIGERAFDECSNLRSLKLPDGLISIGDYAFSRCNSLTTITIPNSLSSLSEGSFFGCQSLTSIMIPEGVTSIRESAFSGCKTLKSIVLPKSISFIGRLAFGGCEKLETITIPDKIESIESAMFQGCSGLTTITMPNSVKSIGQYAFEDCTNLSSIKLPENLTSIDYGAFYGCTSINSVELPKGINYVGQYAFRDCSCLSLVKSRIEIPFDIDKYVFYGISSSAKLEVPTGTKSKYQALSGWTNSFKEIVEFDDTPFDTPTKRTVHVASAGTLPELIHESEKYIIEELTLTGELNGTDFRLLRDMAGNNYLGQDTPGKLKVLDLTNAKVVAGGEKYLDTNSINRNKESISGSFHYDISQSNEIPQYVFSACHLEEIFIPNSVTTIGASAFQLCRDLTSVTIPNSVTSIGASAFSECSGLTSIMIPNSVTSIEDQAFSWCSGLTSLTIPNSVTTLGERAFSSCRGLTSISISNTLTSIKALTFSQCKSLTSIVIPNSVTSIGGQAFWNCTRLTSIVIPNSVTSIENAAFSECIGLTSLEIPNSVTSIEDYAFQNCRGLTSITIPNAVTSISEGVFYGCSALTFISIPNSVKSIRTAAFQDCRNITSITIPNSVTSIGGQAFAGCSGLTSITIPNSVTSIGGFAFSQCSALTSIMIPDAVTTIGQGTFIGCSSLASIAIPNTVTRIEAQAFSGCSGLTSITIPNAVTSIGWSAFSRCIGLTSITIPNSVTSILDSAFMDCKNLTLVNSYIEEPYNIDGVFDNISSSAKLQVPKGTKSKYQALSGWADYFKEIVELGDASIYILSISVTGNGSASYGGTTIRGKESSFIVNGETSATIKFTPDDGFRIKKVSVNGSEVPVQDKGYTISGFSSNTTVDVEFEAIPSYTLSLTVKGGGTVFCDGNAIRDKTVQLSVKEDTWMTVTIFSDSGYEIRKLIKDGLPDASLSNYRGAVSRTFKLSKNLSMEVEFEEVILDVNISQYVSVESIGGEITLTNDLINSGSQMNWRITNNSTEDIEVKDMQLVDGQTGTWYAKSVKQVVEAGATVTCTILLSDQGLHIPVTCRFKFGFNGNDYYADATYTGNSNYILTVIASGTGTAEYNGSYIRNQSSTFGVQKKTSVTVKFTPDDDCMIKDVVVDGTTVSVNNNQYTIHSFNKNTTVEVVFIKYLKGFETEEVNYSVVSETEKTVKVAAGNYGKVLEVPATVNYQNAEWMVIGIDNGTLAGNSDLAAITWHPEAVFTEQVSNPNLLLYVKSADYAPTTIKNVVVNGVAESILLTDAESGNNFYCPLEFTARSISYEHHYGMTTGIGEARGWETLALPFDVQKVTHTTKGDMTPFANWKSGDTKKPFWLMTYGNSGWTEASSIKANSPYIISMPNHSNYKSEFRLNGRVTFSAENVTVPTSDNLNTTAYNGKTFIPNYSNQSNKNFYALNVNNDLETYIGSYVEGSMFLIGDIADRVIHPFEAYMTTISQTRGYIAIDEDLTTDMGVITDALVEEKRLSIYNLNGQLIRTAEDKSLYEIQKSLPAGVYIVNGKKIIIR